MMEFTQDEVKVARTLGLRSGDVKAAMSLFACYIDGREGYEKDVDKAFKYLEYAANLGHPEALHIITQLYGGRNWFDIPKKTNLNMYVKYLKILYVVDKIVDFNLFNKEEKENFSAYQWEAYATLGRLYIMEESLNSLSLGYAISLKLTEEYNMTESLFAMGWYYYYKVSKINYKIILRYFERALNNDNSFWAKKALQCYNSIAEEVNQGINDEKYKIPYYKE